MNIIQRGILPLCLLAPVISNASVIYSYEAECVGRFTTDHGLVTTSHGCQKPITGQIILPADYVPGTSRFYEFTFSDFAANPDSTVRFSLFDDVYSINGIPLLERATVLLPAQTGPGLVRQGVDTSWVLDIQPTGSFFWGIENLARFPDIRFIDIFGSNTVFTLLSTSQIPEPSGFALAVVALAALRATSRKSAKA